MKARVFCAMIPGEAGGLCDERWAWLSRHPPRQVDQSTLCADPTGRKGQFKASSKEPESGYFDTSSNTAARTTRVHKIARATPSTPPPCPPPFTTSLFRFHLSSSNYLTRVARAVCLKLKTFSLIVELVVCGVVRLWRRFFSSGQSVVALV